MFSIALLVGVYSYLIFCLGVSGHLTTQWILGISGIYLLLLILYYYQKIRATFDHAYVMHQWTYARKTFLSDRVMICACILLGIQGLINLAGTLSPEFAFDALWYHLTLPKIFLQDHVIHHISGGLLYYSDMPKLGEMLFAATLSLGNEMYAKLLQYLFGILITIAVYRTARNFFSARISLLASVVFYANLVVAWESTTAYVDLIRTFFEVLAFRGILNWQKTGERKWFVESACLVGLAICTKLIAVGTLVIMLSLLFSIDRSHIKTFFKNSVQYIAIAFLVALPWFSVAYIATGNPLYPVFSHYDIHQTLGEIVNPIRLATSLWQIFTHADDPIVPIYLIIAPLLFFKRKKIPPYMSLVYLYSMVAVIVWYVTPQTGGGRFMLPYLPVLSIAVVSVFDRKYPKQVVQFLTMLILIIASISIVFRGLATAKYIPVLIGRETKDTFLTNHLNFSFGDFYDTDEYFTKAIRPTDRVLLYGFHNLYYVDFPFIDSSWVKTGDRFNFVAVQNSTLPKRFNSWNLIYINPKTHVYLYTKHYHEWIY